jgi:exopolysaccharide biosynthesis protein
VDAERGADNLTVYNHWYGSRTRTNEFGREYTVVNGKVTALNTGNSVIPKNGCVVSVHGKVADAFAGVKVGDRAVISQELGAPWNQALEIMGAGPRLVQNGQVNVTAGAEQFPSDIRYGRAPRSAVAILKNGNYLFGVVDGRQASSKGLTLTDWAKLLVKMGAKDAMNLDGGGSSALVVGGQLQNSPSDGHERSVGSALVLTNK